MSKNEAFFTWYEGMIRTIEDAETDAELSFFHDHRTACKTAWDARSDLIPKLPEDVERFHAVWSVTGMHIGTWKDGKIAADVHAGEYPDGRSLELVPADALTAQAARIAELEGALRECKAECERPNGGRLKAADIARAALGETHE